MEHWNIAMREQINIKDEPCDDTQQPNTSTVDFEAVKDVKKIEISIGNEPVIKGEPISDDEFSQQIENTNMCTSTLQNSDGVTVEVKVEPAADVGFDEPAYQLTDTPTVRGSKVDPAPVKIEVEVSVDRLQGPSLEHEQQVVPSKLRRDVCVSGKKRKVKVKKHTNGTYQCDMCEKSFKRKGNLIIHIRTHTGERPYKCSSCSKTFVSYSNLYEHIRTHTGFKPYKCDMCDKAFAQQTNLKRHILIHTGERPYKCTMCDRSFTHSFSLQIHIRAHNGDKPYKCDTCDKSFSHQCHLKVHIRIHTGERPYICDICNKNFIQFGDLKKHSRTHTDERPYKCTMCDKGFNDSRNLKRHTLIHTRDRPHKCDSCDSTYSRLYQLKTHMRKNH